MMKEKKKKKVNKNVVEESSFQTKKWKLDWKGSFWLLKNGANGLIVKDFLFLLEDRDWIHICLVKRKKKSSSLRIIKRKVFNWNMKTWLNWS